jgi:hypothetical protein
MFDLSCNFCLFVSELLEANPSHQHAENFIGEISISKNYFLNNKLYKIIIVLFFVFGFSISQSFGQRDQITTQAGEKIRCRILNETSNRFVYAYLSPSGKVLKSEIFKNLVSEFKYNFYSNLKPLLSIFFNNLHPPKEIRYDINTSKPFPCT